jgi:hypothetical protein
MVVGSIVRKIGGTQKYKIVEINDDSAICLLYPHGSQSVKYTFKLSELELAN